MRTAARSVAVMLVAAGALVFGPHAQAGCHAFTAIAPNTVSEGNTISVRIERDAALSPSSVRVTTVSGTAAAPSDFKSVDQRVAFTNETSRMITIQTAEDTVDEQNETFTIRLSDARGCTGVNTNYEYGTPERVTISDDDVAVATTAPPMTTPPATAAPTSTPSFSAAVSPSAGSPSPSVSPSATPSPTLTPIALPIDESDDDFPWVPIALGAAIVAAGAGALAFSRMRQGGAPGV